MIHLLIMMVERVGVIVILGFLLAHTKVFWQFLRKARVAEYNKTGNCSGNHIIYGIQYFVFSF